jgi:hypothetical protein
MLSPFLHHNYHILRVKLLDGPAHGLHLLRVASANRHEDHLAFLKVDQVVQPAFEEDQVVGGQAAKEDGLLATEAEVLAGPGDVAEPPGMTDVDSEWAGDNCLIAGCRGFGVPQSRPCLVFGPAARPYPRHRRFWAPSALILGMTLVALLCV